MIYNLLVSIKNYIFKCKIHSLVLQMNNLVNMHGMGQNLKQAAQKRSKIKDDTKSRHASEASELMMVMICVTVFEQHYKWLPV